MGPTLNESKSIFPPKSFLHVEKYKTPKELAEDIIRISQDEKTLLSYHTWRKYFKVLNEHGYFGTPSRHFCRICEGLNYNDKSEKIYDSNLLNSFLNPQLLCH